MPLSDLLEQNRLWSEAQTAADPDYFRKHVEGQKPRILLIGCSDSRVPAEAVLGCGPGELFVHRNVANIVAYNDVNIASVIQYAVQYLKVPDVVVCGHYLCGGVAAACADNIAEGYVADWLMITTWAKGWVDERLAAEGRQVDPAEYLRLVVDENVRLQMKHLANLTIIRRSWRELGGLPRIHGWVYDVSSGRVNVVSEVIQGPDAPNLPPEATGP